MLGLSVRHHSNDVCVFMHGTQILFLLLEMMSQGISRQGEAQASELEDGRIGNELHKAGRHLWADTDFHT